MFLLSRDLSKLEDGIGEKVIQYIHFLLASVGSLALAFTKGWLLALVCLSSLPVTMISIGLVAIVSITHILSCSHRLLQESFHRKTYMKYNFSNSLPM